MMARLADVSPKTLTAVFGSKWALLAEVINPDAFSPRARQLIEELRATEDVSRQFSLVAQITRQAYEPLASSLELLRTAGAVALELYRMLVVEQRWESERSETWLAQLLAQHLLASH